MKFVPSLCPKCGSCIKGTLETLPALATLDYDGTDGSYQYSGWTDVHWNGQKTVTTKDKPSRTWVQCDEGHTFAAVCVD